MPNIIELRPDKGLMDPDFEKYQFIDDPIPILEMHLEKEVLRVEPNTSQDSLLEARSFAYHNHLYKNPFNGQCYFINKDHELWTLNGNISLQLIHTFKEVLSPKSVGPVYNPSLSFASENIIVGSSGKKNVEIVIKNDLQKYQTFVFDDIEPGIILDSVYAKEKSLVNVVMCYITEVDGKKHSEIILRSYSLSIISENSEQTLFDVKFVGKRLMRVKGAVEYANLESNGNYLHITSQDSATFVDDSLSPISKELPVENNHEINIPKYCWSQDEDSLTVWLKIVDGIDKSQIKVDVKPYNILVKCKDLVLMSGESGHRLDPNLTTWTREKDTLKIDLFKNDTGLMWNELIKGDTGGECLPNATLAAEVHSRLAHLCTTDPETGAGHPVLGFNSEQLEECDIQERENQLQRIHLDSHKTTHLAILGTNNHLLFTDKVKYGRALCMRHDHDGCIWFAGENENDKEWGLKHISTLPGFGYVEASKTNKKFCVVPPDSSYVAVVEYARHVFLYEKPVGDSRIGHQRIVDLGCETQANPVLGAIATNRYLYLLTKSKLYQLQVKP